MNRSLQLKQLDVVLKKLSEESNYVIDFKDFDPSKLGKYRDTLYNKSGVFVITNAITENEIDQARKRIGKTLINMYPVPDDIKGEISNGKSFEKINSLRKLDSGWGVSTFWSNL